MRGFMFRAMILAFVLSASGSYGHDRSKDSLPSMQEMMTWIEDISSLGLRRPGTEVDRQTRKYIVEKLRGFGFRTVEQKQFHAYRHRSPWKRKRTNGYVYEESIGASEGFRRWYADKWSLKVNGRRLKSFFVPNTAHTGPSGVKAEIVYVGDSIDDNEDVRGKIALADVHFAPLDIEYLPFFSYFSYDPGGTAAAISHPASWVRLNFEGRNYVTEEIDLGVYGQAVSGGAKGFIGITVDYPGNTPEYYGPYDDLIKEIPGLWVSRETGKRLVELIDSSSVRAEGNITLTGGIDNEALTGNVVAVLPATNSEDVIILGTHHDGPFNSPVEDGTGIAEVLALAKHYSRVPLYQRKKTLVFVFQAGHFYNSIGGKQFLINNPDIASKAVLEIHLEHIAKYLVYKNGAWVDTGEVEPRAVFTTANPLLIDAMKDAIQSEDLRRTFVLQTGSPLKVPHDGAMYYVNGIPILGFISGPEWLLHSDDTIDKAAEHQLVPVARTFERVVDRVFNMPGRLIKTSPPVPPPLPPQSTPVPYPGPGDVYEGYGMIRDVNGDHPHYVKGRAALYHRAAFIDTAADHGWSNELVYFGVDGTDWEGPWIVVTKENSDDGRTILNCMDEKGLSLRVLIGPTFIKAEGDVVQFWGQRRAGHTP
jgi:hypothetical protein